MNTMLAATRAVACFAVILALACGCSGQGATGGQAAPASSTYDLAKVDVTTIPGFTGGAASIYGVHPGLTKVELDKVIVDQQLVGVSDVALADYQATRYDGCVEMMPHGVTQNIYACFAKGRDEVSEIWVDAVLGEKVFVGETKNLATVDVLNPTSKIRASFLGDAVETVHEGMLTVHEHAFAKRGVVIDSAAGRPVIVRFGAATP